MLLLNIYIYSQEAKKVIAIDTSSVVQLQTKVVLNPNYPGKCFLMRFMSQNFKSYPSGPLGRLKLHILACFVPGLMLWIVMEKTRGCWCWSYGCNRNIILILWFPSLFWQYHVQQYHEITALLHRMIQLFTLELSYWCWCRVRSVHRLRCIFGPRTGIHHSNALLIGSWAVNSELVFC